MATVIAEPKIWDDPSAEEEADGGAAPPEPISLTAHFHQLIDDRTGPIGRVVGSESEPAGSHRFFIWAADEATTLDVGHVVVAFSEEAAVVGVVDEPRRFSDLRSFLDDYFDRHGEEAATLADDLATRRPEILVFAVTVLATKHLRPDVDSHRPPVSGPVWFATEAAIEYALGRDDYSGPAIPVLLHTNGNAARDDAGAEQTNVRGDIAFQRAPIWLDGDYLLGPEAGHANWTGQSGLATKTSHALFLTSAVFQTLRARGESVAALMFNVKGPDLLWLDKPAQPDDGYETAYREAGCRDFGREHLEAYRALGLDPKPFEHFRIFAPFKPGQAPETRGQAVQLDQLKTAGALNTLRSSERAATNVVFPILWSLEPLLRQPHKVFDRADFDDKLAGLVYEFRNLGIGSLDQLEKKFAEIDDHFAQEPTPNDWHNHNRYTIYKARNRFQTLPQKFGGLLSRSQVAYGNLPKATDPFSDQELRVIDIANCNTNVQELVVDAVIREVWRLAELETLGVEKVIVFVDELNKYAPGGGQGGLRDTLVDIAARGRHLNVVLFGAQQFRSKVDDEILGNCGTSLYGRIGDEELTNSAYRSLSETVKAELLGLPKGRLLVRHAHFRAPLFGTFPLPPTMPGMAGQRVFNDAKGAPSPRNGHVGDGLFRTLQRHMADGAPRKHEVLTLTDGLDPTTVEEIAFAVDRKARERNGNHRFNPWSLSKDLVARARARA